MIQIEKIEVKYFRSVYSIKLKNIKDVTVLSGKNDCGKSFTSCVHEHFLSLNTILNSNSGHEEPRSEMSISV